MKKTIITIMFNNNKKKKMVKKAIHYFYVLVTFVLLGKAFNPISLTEEGIDICFNDSHPLNALNPIEVAND